MKPQQWNARSRLPTHTLERTTYNSREFGVGQLAVFDTEPGSSGVVTDREFARAAYTQAVALYDRCIHYATPMQVVTSRPRRSGKAIAAERGL